MRLVVVLLAVMMLLAPTRVAVGGACPDCPPPSLHDDDGKPTVKQAITATKALFGAMRGEDAPHRVTQALAIPFLYDLSGRDLDDLGCYDGASYVAEREGMPGRPKCLIAVLGKTSKKLAKLAVKKAVFASLAALENKHGVLRADAREELAPLVNHRLVHLKKGSLRVVVAVRLSGGAPIVDAVVVDPPKR